MWFIWRLRDSRGWSQTELDSNLNFEPQASLSLNGDNHTYLIVRKHLKALAHQRHLLKVHFLPFPLP